MFLASWSGGEALAVFAVIPGAAVLLILGAIGYLWFTAGRARARAGNRRG